MAFYRAGAYDQLYRWSVDERAAGYAAFIALIGESNDANRSAMTDLGVVIANHVLSTVDAYITIRVTRDARAVFRCGRILAIRDISFQGRDRPR